jgi:hypothetical protein
MPNNAQTKLEVLTKRKQKIDNQIRQIQSKEGSNKRKLDTRRKILLGAIFEKLIIERKIQVNDVNQWLQNYLIRDRDRELFSGYFESLGFKKKEELEELPRVTEEELLAVTEEESLGVTEEKSLGATEEE